MTSAQHRVQEEKRGEKDSHLEIREWKLISEQQVGKEFRLDEEEHSKIMFLIITGFTGFTKWINCYFWLGNV